MADPPAVIWFQHTTGCHLVSPKMLDEEFLNKHTKVLLRSGASDIVWEIKLDGDKLAGGWKEFAAAHYLIDGDVLIFKHGGDENFRVIVHSVSNFGDTDTDTEDSYSDDDDDDDDDDNVVVDENIENISIKEHKKPEAADSSSGRLCTEPQPEFGKSGLGFHSFITARVTRYTLRRDRLDLSRDFKIVSFEEDNKVQEIDLANEKGRRWTLRLAKNSSSGVFYIRRGWKTFCFDNGLREGNTCKFKLVENGKRHVLWLCPQDSGYSHEEKEEEEEEEEGHVANEMKCSIGEASKGEEKKKNPSAFLTLKLTPSRYKSGKLCVSSAFTRKNDIKKYGEITLEDKYGRKWSSYLQISGREGSGSEWSYLRRGWREMCEANGVKVNDSFVLEFIWEDAKPVFKFSSKIENNVKGNQRTRKKRACETVEKTRREFQEDERRGFTQASNQTTTNSRKLRRTETKACTVSDQVANVKRCIVDTLNTVRKFRLELETKGTKS